jgi:hypothetical protein
MLHTPVVAVVLTLELLAQAPGNGSSWVVVRSKEGAFSVSMPAQPQEQSMDIPGPLGTVKAKMYICASRDGAFLVQQIALPNSVPTERVAAELQAAKKVAAQKLPKAVSEKPIKVGDVVGLELVHSGPAGPRQLNQTIKIHMFIKGSSSCSLMVISPADKPLPADADKFLDSIRFGDQPATGAAMAKAAAGPKAEAGSATGAPAPKALAKPAGPVKRKALAKIEVADKTPEEALRTFLMAMTVADETALRAVTLPHREIDRLLRGEEPPFRGLEALKQEMHRMPIERLRAGAQVRLPGNEVFVVRTQDVGLDRAVLQPQSSPTPLNVRRVNGHWKVDASPIIEGRKAADTERQRAAGK